MKSLSRSPSGTSAGLRDRRSMTQKQLQSRRKRPRKKGANSGLRASAARSACTTTLRNSAIFSPTAPMQKSAYSSIPRSPANSAPSALAPTVPSPTHPQSRSRRRLVTPRTKFCPAAAAFWVGLARLRLRLPQGKSRANTAMPAQGRDARSSIPRMHVYMASSARGRIALTRTGSHAVLGSPAPRRAVRLFTRPQSRLHASLEWAA